MDVREQVEGERQRILSQVLHQLASALDQLDEADAPAHIGAHLDLAIHQLRQAIGTGRCGQLLGNA